MVVNNKGRLLSSWPARKVFTPGDFSIRWFEKTPATEKVATKAVEEEVATLPVWRRADLGEWTDVLNDGLNEFMDGVDDATRAWIEDADDHPIQTDEEGVSI
jgi:hypothetical protein